MAESFCTRGSEYVHDVVAGVTRARPIARSSSVGLSRPPVLLFLFLWHVWALAKECQRRGNSVYHNPCGCWKSQTSKDCRDLQDSRTSRSSMARGLSDERMRKLPLHDRSQQRNLYFERSTQYDYQVVFRSRSLSISNWECKSKLRRGTCPEESGARKSLGNPTATSKLRSGISGSPERNSVRTLFRERERFR